MHRRRLFILQIIFLGGIIFQIGWYAMLWTNLLNRTELMGTDFISFYTAGKIANQGDLSQLYNLELQQSIQQTVAGPNFANGVMLPFMHPPFLVPLLGLLVGKNYVTAYVYWSLLMVAVLGGCVFLMARFLMRKGWNQQPAWVVAITAILFYPVFISLLKGQDTAILLLGVVVWMIGLYNRQDKWAGLGLALTTIKPQIAIILAVPFVMARRRVWGWFCMGAGGLVLISLALVRYEGVQDFFKLMQITAEGVGYGVNKAAMFNLTGIVVRWWPDLNLVVLQAITWGGVAMAIVWLCYLWYKAGDDLKAKHIGLALILSLFAAPHLHFHDLSLLIGPGLGVVMGLTPGKRLNWSMFLMLGCSLLLIITNILPSPWYHWGGYGVMIGLGIALWQKGV